MQSHVISNENTVNLIYCAFSKWCGRCKGYLLKYQESNLNNFFIWQQISPIVAHVKGKLIFTVQKNRASLTH